MQFSSDSEFPTYENPSSRLLTGGNLSEESGALLAGRGAQPIIELPQQTPEDASVFRNAISPAETEAAPSQPQLPEFFGVESRLSECGLWFMHKHYYDRMGVEAWNNLVPCFVTNSAFLAESYADMILSFLRDNRDRIDPTEPVYILELASGVGRLAHLIVRELAERMPRFEALKDIRFCYVMSDFTENNLKFWRSHEKLQPWIEKGMLDFALFQPADDTHITLSGGRQLSSETLKNPLIAIANYLFDSLPQDVFRVIDGQLYEGRVTLNSSWKFTLDEPPRFGEISTHYRYQTLPPNCSYYDDPELDAILEEYRKEVADHSTLLFPIGALQVLRNLYQISNDNLMLLSSDKAFSAVDHMTCYSEHGFSAHGSFSYMVNYDAIGRYFRNRGGWDLRPSHWSGIVLTVCCGLLKGEAVKNEQLNYYFNYYVSGSNAISSVVYLHPDESPGMSRVLSLLRVSLADPRSLCELGKEIIDALPSAGIEQQYDLVLMLERTWKNFYFYRGEHNLPYWLGEIYYHLGLYEQSLFYLDEALKCYDEYAWEYYQMKGRAYGMLNQWDEALAMYDRALELNPESGTALHARKSILDLLQSLD